MQAFYIANMPVLSVYSSTEKMKTAEDGCLRTNVADENLYGTTGSVLKEEGLWYLILSSYGYSGYVEKSRVILTDEAGIKDWNLRTVRTSGLSTDVLTAPSVHGALLLTLPKGAVLSLLEEEKDGWCKVQLADGREGFAAACRLEENSYPDRFLFECNERELIKLQQEASEKQRTAIGGLPEFSFTEFLQTHYPQVDPEHRESIFRSSLINTARSYLGVQYRWAGRSSFGIDCSGLVHMTYLLNGLTVYRDASIVDRYPLKRLPLEFVEGSFDIANFARQDLRPGDTLYFPGHIALYLGDGRYIHSTGKAGDLGVVINSLIPGTEEFREDLLKSLYGAAGLR